MKLLLAHGTDLVNYKAGCIMQTGGDLVNEGSLAEAVTTGFGVECVLASISSILE